MHQWGDVDKEGNDICARVDEIAEYIGEFLRKYGRIRVAQYKEKFGTVRVYCTLGVYSHPLVNFFIIPYHKFIYRLGYKRALKKWPDYAEEILDCADYPELLEGLYDRFLRSNK